VESNGERDLSAVPRLRRHVELVQELLELNELFDAVLGERGDVLDIDPTFPLRPLPRRA
jgi:hypothetical protein